MSDKALTIGSITFGPSIPGKVGDGITTYSELSKDGIGQSFGASGIKQNSGSNNKIGGLRAVGHQRLCIWSGYGKDNINIVPHATYVACAGHQDFPHVIRVYDANGFNGRIGHPNPPSLKSRFGRSCRAFVNAWKAS